MLQSITILNQSLAEVKVESNLDILTASTSVSTMLIDLCQKSRSLVTDEMHYKDTDDDDDAPILPSDTMDVNVDEYSIEHITTTIRRRHHQHQKQQHRTVAPISPASGLSEFENESKDSSIDSCSADEACLSSVILSLSLKEGKDDNTIISSSTSNTNARSAYKNQNNIKPNLLHRTRKDQASNVLSALTLSKCDKLQTRPLELETQKPSPPSVSFNEVVSALLIPKRSEYSNEQKSVLFHTSREIASNVSRNLLEFAAEGYCVSDVLEEEDMITNEDGEQIHPVHLISALASGRQAPPPTCKAAARETRSFSKRIKVHRPTPRRITTIVQPIPQRPIHPSLRKSGESASRAPSSLLVPR
jgi:hypothetical protein